MAPNHSRNALDDVLDLKGRVKGLEASRALGAQAAAVTSTSHPANPARGRLIVESDTGLQSWWNGTAWVYPPQRIGVPQVLAASAGSITFSGVPQVFSALRVVWSARSDSGIPATYMCLRLNGDTTNSYLWQINQANGATSQSGNSGPSLVSMIKMGTMAAATATAGYIGAGEFVIPNPGGNTYKAPSGSSNSAASNTNTYSGAYGGLWVNTAAVTSLTLLPEAGNLVAGSSAALYGM